MNNVEILGIAALLIGSVVFLSACFLVVRHLDKNAKLHKQKPKKA